MAAGHQALKAAAPLLPAVLDPVDADRRGSSSPALGVWSSALRSPVVLCSKDWELVFDRLSFVYV